MDRWIYEQMITRHGLVGCHDFNLQNHLCKAAYTACCDNYCDYVVKVFTLIGRWHWQSNLRAFQTEIRALTLLRNSGLKCP